MIRISTIIPAYNADAYIERAVDSALIQQIDGAEVLVVDDGSTDATREMLAAYGGRIRVISQPNRGLSNARNRGILEARGTYVAFLDADDYWRPGKLAAQLALLASDPTLGFVSCHAALLDEHGHSVGSWTYSAPPNDLLAHLFRRNAAIPASGSGVVVRRELFAAAGLFDSGLRSLEDIDMWMRLAAITRFGCVPEELAVIVRRGDSMSGDFVRMLASAREVMCRNRSLLPPNLRGRFWRGCYGAMLTDYAKWAYRRHRTGYALRLLSEAAARSSANWRLAAGLGLAIVQRRPL